MAALGLIVSLNASRLAHFFLGNDEVTVHLTVQLTYILAAMLPLLGVEMSIGGSLRGAGDTRFPLFSTFTGLIAMRCGLSAFFIWLGLPVLWVYASMIADYILKAMLLIWRFRSGRWVNAIRRAREAK